MLSEISPKAEINSMAWVNPENVVIEEGVIIGPGCAIGIPSVTVEREFLGVLGDHRLKKAGGTTLIKKNSNLNSHVAVSLGRGENTVTTIGRSVICGSHVLVAHDCYVGDNSIVLAHSALMGHVKIGKNCWIGPGSMISNRIEIGNNAYISIGSVVTQNVEKGKHVTGNFAIDHEKFIENIKRIR